MSDKVYVPDEVPSNFKYGEITRDYVDLYPKSSFRDETTDYYRIYYNYSSGIVQKKQRTFSSYGTTYYDILPTSREVFDRPDFANILSCVFFVTIFGIMLFNIITSFIRKGGIFNDLL